MVREVFDIALSLPPSTGILWAEELHSGPGSHETHRGRCVGYDLDGEVLQCGGPL